MKKTPLYIFSNGRVAAIDKKSGDILWEVKMKEYVSATVAYNIGQLMAEGDKLYLGVAGIILCLSAKDGSLIWKNELKGWGYNFVSIAGADAAGAEIAAQSAATASVIAATTAS